MRQLLVYRSSQKECAAVMEDDRLVQWSARETSSDQGPEPGTILLGRIHQMLPALNAAYVDIGLSEPAFLPLDGRDLSAYRAGLELPVQIKKPAEGFKKISVTDNYSLQGRYAVLTSRNPRTGVSGKITDQSTRRRLKRLLEGFKGLTEAGYILRTESQDAPEEAILEEASLLYQTYTAIEQRKRYTAVGETLYARDSFVLDLLMDEGIGTFDEVIFEEKDAMNGLLEALRLEHIPIDERKIRLFEDARFSLPDVYRIGPSLEEALSERVFIGSSGYLVIERTEALSVIDVNSGNLSGTGSKEEAITSFNLQCIPEIVRQIRLRNLSGILLIDFINMDLPEDRERVVEALREAFRADSRKVTVYGLTSLQLCELTRERAGLPLSEAIK